MTLAQIAAILSLLLAFGVDKPTVDNISTILNAATPTVQTQNTPFTEIATTTVLFTPQPTQNPSFGATIQSTPTFTPVQTPMPVKNIELRIGTPGLNNGVTSYEIHAYYTEDNEAKQGIPITLSGSDGGTFTNISPIDLVTVDTATGEGNDPRGLFKGSVIIKTHFIQGKQGVYAVYTPAGKDVTITASADGATISAPGYNQN